MAEVENKIVFIDIETAGLRPSSPIIEVAAVAVSAGSYHELETMEMKVAFQIKDANVRSLGVSKFRPSLWEQYAIPSEDAAQKLAAFLRQHATRPMKSKKGKSYQLATLAAHHAQFDVKMLERWFRRHKVFFPAMKCGLCTEQKSRWFFADNQGLLPPDNYQLGTLAKHLGLKNRPNHTALADVRATVELARLLAEYNRIGVSSSAA